MAAEILLEAEQVRLGVDLEAQRVDGVAFVRAALAVVPPNEPECPQDYFCQPDSYECAPGRPRGDECNSSPECNSGFCVDGVCCTTVSCPSGATCQRLTGECVPPPTSTPLPTRTRTPTSTRIPSLTPTVSPVIEIRIGRATGAPGETVSVDISFAVFGSPVEVAGTQNDIGFDALGAVVANERGRPDCAPNPAISKSATSFSFQPPGCAPESNCAAMRSFVLSVENVDPIPDGSIL